MLKNPIPKVTNPLQHRAIGIINGKFTPHGSEQLNRMKYYFNKNYFKPITLLIFLISLISLKGDFLNAEYLFEELEIDTSTKKDDTGSVIPTNPFEIVEMIRRQNSLNDATKPSDAIDDALKSFNNLEEKEEI